MRHRAHNKTRSPRRVLLVVCEGETERVYVEMLRRHYRLPITIKSKVIGNRINKRLLQQFLKEEGLESPADYLVVFMYDADVESVVTNVKKLNGVPIFSTPCIELWFLLHHQEFKRPSSTKEIVDILDRSWNGYIKGRLTEKQKEILLSKRFDASERAKRLDNDKNPSSEMWRFLKILEDEKNC